MLGVCSECIVLGNASMKMQFGCRVYHAKNKNTQIALKFHAESMEKYTFPLRENVSLLGVLGMCSELGWGVSCEIEEIQTMSVVYTFWNVLNVLERFGTFCMF